MLHINWYLFWAIISLAFLAGFCCASLFIASDKGKHKLDESNSAIREIEARLSASEWQEFVQEYNNEAEE